MKNWQHIEYFLATFYVVSRVEEDEYELFQASWYGVTMTECIWWNFVRGRMWMFIGIDEKLTAYWVFSGNILCCIQSWGGWRWIDPGIMVWCGQLAEQRRRVHLMEVCQRKDVNVYWQHFMLYQNWGGCGGTIPSIILWCNQFAEQRREVLLVKGCQQIDVNVYWQHFMLCLVLRRMEVDCWCVKVWASSLTE